MPNNKEQHFVPASYLKLFSVNKRTINLHNLATKKTIFNAKLKTQCRREYLYGKEDLSIEKGLCLIESAAASAIKSITAPPRTPTPQSNELARLTTFAIFQHHRTMYAAHALDEMASELAKTSLAYDPRFSADFLNSIEIGLVKPAVLATQSASRSLHFGLDLACKMVISKDGCEFITSDNPAVFYNQALENCTYHGLGIACKGLQILLPISPEILLIFYDSQTYKVGNKKLTPIKISEQSDMDQINKLIYANADENIYFISSDKINLKCICQGQHYRLQKKSKIETYTTQNSSESYSDLLVSSKLRPRSRLTLSFIKELKAAKALRASADNSPFGSMDLFRDPNLILWDQRYQITLDNGSKHNFFEFMAAQH